MKQRGVTLIELVVTIVIVSIAIASVLGAISSSAVNSSNRMIEQQASAIASAYLEEIMQRPFNNPNAGYVHNGARDQTGALVAGLDQYTVNVQLGPGVLNGLPAGSVQLITITVTHANGVTVLANGYKTNHPMP